MEIKFTDEALQDLESLTPDQLAAVKNKLETLRENPTSHEDTKLIRVKDRDVYRLKVREQRGGEIDHRIIYDIQNGRIRIYSIFPRDHGYNNTL